MSWADAAAEASIAEAEALRWQGKDVKWGEREGDGLRPARRRATPVKTTKTDAQAIAARMASAARTTAEEASA